MVARAPSPGGEGGPRSGPDEVVGRRGIGASGRVNPAGARSPHPAASRHPLPMGEGMRVLPALHMRPLLRYLFPHGKPAHAHRPAPAPRSNLGGGIAVAGAARAPPSNSNHLRDGAICNASTCKLKICGARHDQQGWRASASLDAPDSLRHAQIKASQPTKPLDRPDSHFSPREKGRATCDAP